MNTIKVGSRWRTVDGMFFTVTKTELRDDNDAWVYYTNEARSFSCRQASFTSRFTETT